MPGSRFRAQRKRLALSTGATAPIVTVFSVPVVEGSPEDTFVGTITVVGATATGATQTTDASGCFKLVQTSANVITVYTTGVALSGAGDRAIGGSVLLLNLPSVAWSGEVEVTASTPATYDSSAQAFFDAGVADGLAALSTPWKVAYNNLIVRAKAKGWWDTTDVLRLFDGPSLEWALRNVKSDEHHAVVNGTVNHVPQEYLDMAGTGYLTSDYNPATKVGAKYVRNSARMGIGIVNYTAETKDDMRLSGSSNDWFYTNNLNGDSNGRVNQNANVSGSDIWSSLGYWINGQISSDNRQWRNSTSVASRSRPSVARVGGTEIIGSTSFNRRQYCHAHWGGLTDYAMVQALYEDLKAWHDAAYHVGSAGHGEVGTHVKQRGVKFSFGGAHTVGQYCNGDWWVHNPALGSGLQITEITPNTTSVDGNYRPKGTFTGSYTGRVVNGAMRNPGNKSLTGGTFAGNWRGSDQGYDSLGTNPPGTNNDNNINTSILAYSSALNVDPANTGGPIVFAPGEEGSIVKTIHRLEPVVEGREATEHMVVLTVVAEIPADDAFRPPVATTDKASPWRESDLDYAILPSFAIPPSGTMLMTAAADIVERPQQVQYTDNVKSRLISPMSNQEGYGVDIAKRLSNIAVMLCLDFTDAEKRDLYVYLVQYGIDLYGRVVEGGRFPGIGGSNQRHKFPLLLAGLALNDAAILAYGTNANLYPDGHQRFAEDAQIFRISQFDVDLPRYTGDPRDRYPYEKFMIGIAEWGSGYDEDSPDYASPHVDMEYRQPVGNSTLGAVFAAMKITGMKAAWGNDLTFEYYDRLREWSTQNVDATSTMVLEVYDANRGTIGVGAFTRSSSTVYQSRLWATYTHYLKTRNPPATTDFAVTVNGVARSVTAVECFGTRLVVTLATPVTAGQTVVWSYTPGLLPAKNLDGTEVPAFAALAASNIT